MDINQNADTPIPAVPPQGEGKNVLMGVLAYLGILIIIPFLSPAKNDPFVKLHLKQGLALIIAWVVVGILWRITFWLFFVVPILNFGCFVLLVIGVMNAARGEMKELPVIGRFAHNFNF